ncbi:MAG: homogentisate 1,2-dioxygenase [Rhodospirillaceae bacterium]|nr:homogentisate 1,2-dioxygenase [Rhodospirillaceae bacterium]
MSKKWISFPKVEGTASRQAHAALPEGTYEREMGREGFFGPATQMHHKHPPTGWTDFEGPLRPRMYDLTRLNAAQESPWDAPMVLSNAHTKIFYWRTAGAMDHLVRSADGDELLFVHAGSGELFCDYGRLTFRDGDYIVLPRGTMWRVACDGDAEFLMIEAVNDAFQLPEKGLVGPHAIFDPAMLRTPEIDDAFLAQQDESEWQVKIKRQDSVSTATYPYNPLDAVGWHGDLAPVSVNWRDIRPLMSHRYHMPPSAHSTFVAKRFVVCTFVPRPFESDPDALKVPFFHNNDDYDEVIFFHKGKFFSRDNTHPGMMSFHPCGFTHGPHPKALQGAFKPKAEATDEVAVMLDARDPLTPADLPDGVEFTAYVESWKGGA